MRSLASFRLCCFCLLIFGASRLAAQAPGEPAAALAQLHIEGLKTLDAEPVKALSGLHTGDRVGRLELQGAADKLLQTGLFSNVRYRFTTELDGVIATYTVEENPLIPVFFDNIPWFGDSELNEAIRQKLPFYKGSLPEAGELLNEASAALEDLLARYNLHVPVEHNVAANPLGDGTVQDFHVEGATWRVGSLDFGDPSLKSSLAVQEQLRNLVGKPFSRMAIDLFLSEQVKPIYLKRGFLKVKLGPAQVRLTANPNQGLPDVIPVFVPVETGPAYRWKGVEWSGNKAISSITLSQDLGLKPGDLADGEAVLGGWIRATEDYGRLGYLDAKIVPRPGYDDQSHTISYTAEVTEGVQYRFGEMVLTGVSDAAERHLKDAWQIEPGSVFDKAKFESFLVTLQTNPGRIFQDLPVHYDDIGHWLRTDPKTATVDVLLDFK